MGKLLLEIVAETNEALTRQGYKFIGSCLCRQHFDMIEWQTDHAFLVANKPDGWHSYLNIWEHPDPELCPTKLTR